ncbi:MAG: hypothetical protein C4567_13275 [Deltaproteobacteria bacterium]|nr:MAG: hypothetical protein C4567_13275 [Deltaproteobacteria bacterium]
MKKQFITSVTILLSVFLISNLSFAATVPPNLKGTWLGSTKIHPGGPAAVRLIVADQQDDFYLTVSVTVGDQNYAGMGQIFLFNTVFLLGANPNGDMIFMAGILDWLPKPTILVFLTLGGLNVDKMYHRFTLTKSTR